MYADIKTCGEKMTIITAFRNLIIWESVGYKTVCTTDLYTVSEL